MCRYSLLLLILLFCSSANVAFGEAQNTFKLQEPKGETETLVDFTPALIQFPFEIKYPAKWYVREEVAGNISCLFFTREPIKKEGDRYSVGASLLYNVGYFASKEPPASPIGQAAEMVIKMRGWEESKKLFTESLKKDGNTVISQTDVTISGQPALRVEYESKNARVSTIYIKAGIHLLVITFEAPPQGYEQYKDVFENILNSFFFTR